MGAVGNYSEEKEGRLRDRPSGELVQENLQVANVVDGGLGGLTRGGTLRCFEVCGRPLPKSIRFG